MARIEVFDRNPWALLRERARRHRERVGRFPGIHTEWKWTISRGGIAVAEGGGHNIFHNDGEQWLVQVAFDETQTVPANFYLGLDDRATLAEGDTLATIGATEPAGNGYARQAVPSSNVGWTTSQDGGTGDWQALSATVSFNPTGGNWGTVRNVFLTDQISAQTGQFLLASQALSTQRTLNDGDQLDTSFIVRVREAA